MDPSDPPIVVEETYAVPPDRLWSAVTDPAEMRDWFFEEMQEFQPLDGFETTFVVELGDKQYTHRWEISGVKANERIVYGWSYDGLPGRGRVTWEIKADEQGSRLRLTNEILEAFPDDDPAFTRESCEGGWAYLLSESLKPYLEGEIAEFIIDESAGE
ncbi:MAG: SRPBCC domain-containing protein [Planctomycetota bacterium]